MGWIHAGAATLAGGLLFLTAAGAQEEGLRFDWPQSCRVTVTERSEKKGATSQVRYEVVLERACEPEFLEVRFENFQFQRVNGMDVSSPEAQKALGPAAQLAAAIPTFLISRGGRFEDALGIEEMVDKTIAFLKTQEGAGMDEARWKSTEAMMKSPQMLAQLKSKVADYWNVWVGGWLGLQIAAGEQAEATTNVPMPDGSLVEAPLRFSHEGAVEGNEGLVRLTAVALLEGPEATRALERSVRKMAEGAGGAEPPPEPMFENFRRITTVTVETDPATLRPAHTMQETLIELTSATGEVRKQREVREHTFDWPTATTGTGTGGK